MKTYDYYCTWQAQNALCQLNGTVHRDYLDEDKLFGENGLVYQYSGLRQDLIFVLDDGWDVPYSKNFNNEYQFGAHILRKDRFPSFTGPNKDKLKMLVEEIKAEGWQGVGIWVCAQGYKEDYNKDVKGLRNYFKKRIEWSKYAGIIYWKVDWGKYDHDVSFRIMLNKLAKKYYPELIIEHAYPMPPVNGFKDNEDVKYIFPYREDMRIYLNKVVKNSEVFRSYDVTEELSTVSTISRLAYLLKQQHSIINCEDELYLGACLGLSLGIQRAPIALLNKNIEINSFHHRTGETYAAIRYRRLSNAFAGTKIKTSKKNLQVNYQFGPYWHDTVTNNNVIQEAPAILARNTYLPSVRKIKELPFVVCCEDLNNNYAIASFKAINYDDNNKYLVDIKTKISKNVDNVAIFSDTIRNLTLTFKDNVNPNFTVIDMVNNKVINHQEFININGNKMIIKYKKMTSDFKCEDESGRAYLISFKK